MREASRRAKEDAIQEMRMRSDNVNDLGGVYTPDEQDGPHRSYTNHWKSVMERKLDQAFTNGFLGFKNFVSDLKSEAQERATNAGVEEALALRRAIRELDRLAKRERYGWDEVMAAELMARCNVGVGSINTGGKGAGRKSGGPAWGSVKLKGARECMNPVCNQRTRNGCPCDDCTRGGEAGVLMCKRCFDGEGSHRQAAKAQSEGVAGRRTRKPMAWLS